MLTRMTPQCKPEAGHISLTNTEALGQPSVQEDPEIKAPKEGQLLKSFLIKTTQ